MATAPSKQLMKFLRPLIWWGIVMLVVGGYFEHKKLLRHTCILFYVQKPVVNNLDSETATLDGQPTFTGQKITLGSHVLKVTHPKGEAFEKKFFAWYGGNDLGTIKLKRTEGHLNIRSETPALTIAVVGPDFSTNLTSVSEASLTVPTDEYAITATYPHAWTQQKKTTVSTAQPETCAFDTPLGILNLTGNQDGETYELLDGNSRQIASGNLPAQVSDLVAGTYQLTANWHGLKTEKTVDLKPHATNEVMLEFPTGFALIDSIPSGAKIFAGNGNLQGKTPLLINGIPPGQVLCRLQLDGYDDVTLNFTIVANQTNSISTNLVKHIAQP